MNERMRELLGDNILGGLVSMFAKAEAIQEKFEEAFENRLDMLAEITMEEVFRDRDLEIGKFVNVGDDVDVEEFGLEIDVEKNAKEGWIKKIAVSTYGDMKVATFNVLMKLTQEEDGIRQEIEVSKVKLV